MKYVPRRAELRILEALGDTRVVVVNGARQAGKSTLVHRLVAARPAAIEHRLDRASDREAATRDPDGFVEHTGLVAIDEVQRVPDLILSIKARVDANPIPGSFLLTGSARLLGLRTLPDALVGRSETVELWPFSQGEIDGVEESFIDAIFSDDVFPAVFQAAETAQGAATTIVERVARGGFPDAVGRAERRRARFFEAYINDLIDRDVVQLAEIQRRDQLRRLLLALAGRVAAPVVVERLASDLALPAATAERYVALLEEVFLIKRIPAWSAANTQRAVRQRKLLFVDSGLAAHLAGGQRALRNPAFAGPLVENFVLGEVARQLTWSETLATLHHFRTRDGDEVDAVIEAHDGRIVGVEVKAARTARDDDFRHLRGLQRKVPDRFHAGLLLYDGQSVLRFGPQMLAVPLPALWLTR